MHSYVPYLLFNKNYCTGNYNRNYKKCNTRRLRVGVYSNQQMTKGTRTHNLKNAACCNGIGEPVIFR